jgi:hypothetical protein
VVGGVGPGEGCVCVRRGITSRMAAVRMNVIARSPSAEPRRIDAQSRQRVCHERATARPQRVRASWGACAHAARCVSARLFVHVHRQAHRRSTCFLAEPTGWRMEQCTSQSAGPSAPSPPPPHCSSKRLPRAADKMPNCVGELRRREGGEVM